jgi:hypothetical protein
MFSNSAVPMESLTWVGYRDDFGIETDVDDRCYILTGQERIQPSENRDGGDGKCNPFDPLGLFGGGFLLNMISPK